jgi:hypothetical protein
LQQVAPEELDEPLDDFYLSLSAHEQAQFKNQLDNSELKYMNVSDIGLPMQEYTQAFSNPPTPSTPRSQDTKHHNKCTAPTIKCPSSADTEPIINTTSSKSLFRSVDFKYFYHHVEFPKEPVSPPEIHRAFTTTTPHTATSRTKTDLPDPDENELESASLINTCLCDTGASSHMNPQIP